MPAETTTMTDPPRQRRWDPVVKLTHWAIALAVLANAVIMEEGSAGHVWVGYGLAAILALRLLWGLIGPAEARFSAFPPSPGRAAAHLREIAAGQPTAHRSHNPLGALMVYAIWGTLLVIIGSGVAMAGLPPTSGTGHSVELSAGAALPKASAPEPEAEAGEEAREGAAGEGGAGEGVAGEGGAGEGGEREEGPLGEVHEAAVNLLYGLILLHIAGVLFESRRQKRNLALAMLPGGR